MGTPELSRSGAQTRPPTVPDVDEVTGKLDPATISALLSAGRRRYVLYYLVGCDDAATVEEITEQVAVWESGTQAAEVDEEFFERVYRSMVHVHLPKLADAGAIEYEHDVGVVTLTDGLDRLRAEVFLAAEREHRDR